MLSCGHSAALHGGLCARCLLSIGLTPDAEHEAGDVTAVRPLRHAASDPEGGASESLTPGTLVAGRFRITSMLGRGGMGEVYRADDLRLGQPVALKFLSAHAERFIYDEVRIGRQIAHPNVCRVYDILDLDGRPFIEMELVDGEDLASLLPRVGRLSYEKALEIGRDVCAGLDAAHQKGIVHGDLKPANVLIDGHGRARITDFGLSRWTGHSGGHLKLAGTLAYMAPEQLHRNEVTRSSDLYSLGLVLYEIFTGRRAHQASTMEELEASFAAPPPRPSRFQRRIDRAIEEAILSCLASDPAERPRSARQVLESFPAADPLDAMVAAGDTPTPDVVAASGSVRELGLREAWMLLTAFAALLAFVLYASERLTLYGRTPLPKEPAVLADRARDIAGGGPFADQGYWFEASPAGAIAFHWRGSPVAMLSLGNDGRLTANDPPLDVPGMQHVILDPSGKPLPAASPSVQPDSSRLPHVVYLFLLTASLAAGAWLARQNLRAGRVDRRAAVRVALWVFVCRTAYGLLVGHHPLTIEKEAVFLETLLGASALLAIEVWLGYVALEPLARRIAPHAMITWTRLVQGRWLDAGVGRDLLAGVAAGLFLRSIDQLRHFLPKIFPALQAVPSHLAVDALGSLRIPVAVVFYSQARAVFYALFALFLLALLRRLLRREWLAGLAWLVATTMAWSRWDDPRMEFVVVGMQMLLLLLLLQRIGLLATAAAVFAHLLTVYVPLTYDLSAFYFPHSAVGVAALVAVALYGFGNSVRLRPA